MDALKEWFTRISFGKKYGIFVRGGVELAFIALKLML
jgi:hypothetical protein